MKLFAIEAWTDAVQEVAFEIPNGVTLAEALTHLQHLQFEPLVTRLSRGVLTDYVPGDIGVNGKRAILEQVLCEFDRIEFYRPLEVDPKAYRNLKVDAQRRREVAMATNKGWRPRKRIV